MTGVLQGRPCEDTGGHKEYTIWWWRQRLEWYVYQPRDTKDYRQPPEAWRGKEGFFLRVLRESTALLKPWFQTFSLQSSETSHFCCLSPPSLWYFVIAAFANSYIPLDFHLHPLGQNWALAPPNHKGGWASTYIAEHIPPKELGLR